MSKILSRGLNKKEWMVHEKIHGANFCFITNGQEVVCAKRTGLLAEEKFYDFQNLLKAFNKKVLNTWNYIKKCNSKTQVLYLYGEFFGGCYPHKDVLKLNVPRINTGVAYSPFHYFCLFDVRIKIGRLYTFLDWIPFETLCKKNEWLYPKELFAGSLYDCLDFETRIDSNIPRFFNLPAVEPNIIEGVVIRPTEDSWIGNERVIIKKKNYEFREVERTQKKNRVNQCRVLSDAYKRLEQKISCYINKNRLENVISKIGPFNIKIIGKINGMFAKDVLRELTLDIACKNLLESLEKTERKNFNKMINKYCMRFIKKNQRNYSKIKEN